MKERRAVLLWVLVFTMTASSFQIFALAVLAVDLIDDLGLSRTGLGLLGSLNTMVGALSAPTMGRVTDRIGAYRAVILVLIISAAGMALTAVAGHWAMLAGAAVVSGLPQGWGNPATNTLIAERVTGDAQGTVTGVKQSGVQVGIFLSGLTLPGLAVWIGWRGAFWGYAVIFLIGAITVAKTLPKTTVEPARPSTPAGVLAPPAPSRPIPVFIWVISLYAFLFGAAGGAIGRFFPLWANEVVGLSTVRAGILVALGGLLAIGTRIGAGQLAQRRMAPATLLSILAAVGALYCLALIVTGAVGSWILWPGAIVYAIGIGAWNTVAMLAIIVTMPKAVAGRASGIVMFGFLGGLSVSAPIAGLVVDEWGSYQPVWYGALALSVASAILIRPGVLTGRATTTPAPKPA